MIAAMRTLTGLSIADIKNRIATSQPLFEIVAFRNDWEKTRYTLVRIAKQIEEGTMPLIVTEESNGFVTEVPLSTLKNMIQRFRQIEIETRTDVELETGEIDDPRDFIPQDADWTR
jgi:hypothetical protein